MTEIDVPDWVVKAADEAGDEFAKTHTMSMYASLADMQRDCVRHMLIAALGAWAGPLIRAAEEEAERRPLSTHKLRAALTALRQEKPE